MADTHGRLGLIERLRDRRLLVVGRAGMDIYADPPGTQIDHTDHFFAALGGSAGNIAVAASRLGADTHLLSKVSDDAVGEFVKRQMQHYGVDSRYVYTAKGEARTSLAIVETRPDARTVLYRNGAADLALDQHDCTTVPLESFGVLVVTGTCLAVFPSREAVLSLMQRANAQGLVVVLDLDYRAYSWSSLVETRMVYQQACDLSHMIVGNEEEFAVVAGNADDAQTFAQRLADNNHYVIYKKGPRGLVAYANGEHYEQTPFSVAMRKPMGAGDAFLGATLAALVTGKGWQLALREGAAAAALNVTGIGCAPANPDRAALDTFLAQHP